MHRVVKTSLTAAALSTMLIAGTAVSANAATGVTDGYTDTQADSTNSLVTAPLPTAPNTGVDEAPTVRSATKKPKKEKTIADVKAGKAVLKVGDTGKAITNLQTRLNQAGIKTAVTGTYTKSTKSAVLHLQSKFLIGNSGKVGPITWRTLASITKRGDKVDSRCYTKKKVLCIDKSQRVLRYMKNGKTLLVLDARFGSGENPTRLGVNYVYSKSTLVISSLYHTPMPYSMFFDGGIAVHYSKYFKAVGYNGHSHGCVNIRDMAKLKWLYKQIPLGTKVVVYQ